MPSNCCVPNCVSNGKTYILLKFYRFPADKKNRLIWKRLVRNNNLANTPFVCCLHFVGGKKTYDNHTPTIYPWTSEWQRVVETHNERCKVWFSGQTGHDHTYARSPRVVEFTPVRHGSSQTKARQTKRSAAVLNVKTETDSEDGAVGCDDADGYSELAALGCSPLDQTPSPTCPRPRIEQGPQDVEEPFHSKNITPRELETSSMVHYYQDTNLLVKSELQSIISSISQQMSNENSTADVTVYKKLLGTVLTLLKNFTEMYDSVIELRTFQRFLLRKFVGSDEDIQFWTGFYSYSALNFFIEHLVKPNLGKFRYWGSKNGHSKASDKCGRKRLLEPEDELFLTLVKLKQGSANEDLAERFNVSVSSVSRIFLSWVKFLETILVKLPTWMSRKKIRKTLPDVFKGLYDDVTIIIDCTEMECEKPSDFELQAATYSEYKSRNTVKALVGISPSGVPTYISYLMEGRVSDNEITMKSGLIEKLESNSVIMADRGWTNKEALARHGIRLITPSFLMDKKQLDLPSLVESVAIARVRIHVERCIGRIKQWKILTRKLHLTEWKALNSIWKVCSHLILFWPPLL